MKNTILLALGLAMSMLLVGCGGSSEGVAEDFLEAFAQKKDQLDTAKKVCRGDALRKIEKYQEFAKEKKKDPNAAWMDDWTSKKDVEKVTDISITSIRQLTADQTEIDMTFEYQLHLPKEKEDKNKKQWKTGRLTVSKVDGSWKVCSFRF